MAETVQLGQGRTGKVRSFWTGFGLAVVTFGLYGLWWYYFVNDELKRVGVMHDDEKLAKLDVSLPVLAWIASVFFFIPILVWYWYATKHQNLVLEHAGAGI
jgi:hypothetical protein